MRKMGTEVEFTINGKYFKVGSEITPDTSLNAFIREHAHLPGTKFMCLEGGCGACIVTIQFTHPATHKKITYAANSCLVPLFSCHGWTITTIEGVGNKFKGYHKIQKRLAAANGTQCGYCSPGMVMNMYSLLEHNPSITMKEIENSFGGNICRCTGYRPILDAFKSLALDAPPELQQRLQDIEDTFLCPKNGEVCKGSCGSKCYGEDIELIESPKPLKINLKDGSEWFRPTTKKEVCEVLDMINNKSYRFVAGNTGQGVFRIDPLPEVYIDLNAVSELRDWKVTDYNLTLGAHLSLTEAMDIFYEMGQKNNNYSYCKTLGDHIDLIANVPVRNLGTLAGNISMKHTHKDFPSDIFLMLETVGAQIVVDENSGVENSHCLSEFLQMDMNKKLITKFVLPTLDKNHYVVTTYKIMPRAQNAHAYVNAGFMFKFNKKDKFKILERPRIVFGGITSSFIHANKTEEFLTGKNILDETILKKALDILCSELNPDHIPPDASPEYRKGLAESLFYKFVLSVNPNAVNQKYRSGGSLIQRPLSSGKQDFDTNKKVWPLNKPVPKIEGLMQCAGEAEYTNDIPSFPDQLWGQLVLCDRSGATITNIDPDPALAIPGVIAFFSAKDVPVNTFIPPKNFFLPFSEKLFADGKTDYAGQAVGIIIAENHNLAIRAAKKVQVTYGNNAEIITDPKIIIDKNITSRITEFGRIDPTTKKDNIKYKIQGDWSVPSQYHYCMETLCCVAVPTEDSLDIYPAAQWPTCVQEAVSHALQIPQNQLNIRVRRLGGGYGSKITFVCHTSVACCLAAVKLHRPVRLVLNLETNMEWSGKRFPVYSHYDAGVDEKGVIQYLNMKMYEDDGHSPNDAVMMITMHHLPSCYDKSTWSVSGMGLRTDNPSNSWCRAPGSVESISTMEHIMEHIAKVTKLDSLDVKIANMTKDNPCIKIIQDIKKSSNYDERKKIVEKYNMDNRWKKRGICLLPMEYDFMYFGNFYGSVSVFKNDGSVAIRHSAIEMGQGCNTKAAQVAAFILGVDLENITVKPADTNVHPNMFVTGGSFGSESACYAIKKACEDINTKLTPVKEKLGPEAKWKDIVVQAYNQGIDLSSQYMFTQKGSEVEPYSIYAAVVAEVEVDILTGQYQIIRMDVIEDAGESLSPEVDIGQVEGSLAMGIGMLTTEELVYNHETGRILTNRTWNYKPPGAKDIPVDLRITLLKNAPNPFGVLRSKATGEPPLCLSNSVAFAIRQAVEAARKDAGLPTDSPLNMELPFTREKSWLAAAADKKMFKL